MAGKGGSGGGGLPNYNNANSSYLPTSMSAGMGGMAPMGLGILGQGPSQFPRSAPLPSSALHDLGFSLALFLRQNFLSLTMNFLSLTMNHPPVVSSVVVVIVVVVDVIIQIKNGITF